MNIKVLSFSLWGNDKKYTIGALKNIECAEKYYPDFQCWFYIHEQTVPKEIIKKISEYKNTKIILKSGNLQQSKPMMWRFEAIDDPNVEIMLSRDTDTRILLREKLAVEEWLKSNKTFHIMRDHPHHTFHILGGMFGTRKIKNIPSWTKIMNNVIQKSNRDYDQTFLKNYIYPNIKDDLLVHSSFKKYKNEICKSFPIQYCNEYRFVGEYVYENENRSLYHLNLLKQHLKSL
jgi:hypothetical protein